ncbi:MAG: phosphoenolpyruvate synthase [Lachnospiraceae bacterium]|nr:phosphoenolpyruvate synthase [Lachnospiraceae bacterium]
MSGKLVLFENIRKEDVNTAGGKGANLGEMTAAGINIPGGGVLLAAAYDEYLVFNGIDPLKYESAESLREAIRQGELPEDIKKEIGEFYAAMGGDSVRLAVRSSATAEDLDDASFAGQQETYLNVTGLTDLYEKIKSCYASLWGDRAVSYRRNSGYDKEKVALAVVIQKMVESESAGVMFTSDPAGDRNNVHINASYGLGEAVVSGIVSPDEYICDRNGTVIKEIIGSKEEKIIYSRADRGTVRVPVDEKARGQAVLDRSLISRLVSEGIRIEAHYGHPMDIEWGICGGKIYILQARSITTFKETDKKIFTDEDFAGYPAVKPAKGSMREAVLFNLEKTPTPYYPLDHDFGGLVGEQKNILFKEFGIEFKGGMYPIDRDGVSYPGGKKFRLTGNITAVPRYLRRVLDIDNNISCADESLKRCREEFEAEKKKTCRGASDIGEALARMRALIEKTAYDRFLYALFPNAVESMRVTRVLKKVDPKLNAYDILEGLSYVTADINRAMKELCIYIGKDEKMTESVMKESYEEICVSCPELSGKFEAFLRRFGSKSDFNCYCFISKTWREDPDRFVNALRPMLKGGGAATVSKEEGERRFNDLMARVKRVVSPSKYRVFEKRVTGLRHYHYIREATQYLWESEFEYCRQLLKKLSDSLGVSYNDLLYLFVDELSEVCKKNDIGDRISVIGARKDKRGFAEAYWDKCMKDALAGEDDSIKGIGASGGQVKGRVCVIKSPAEFYKLEKNDILVCKYTDPEWTPLFALAAGVVVDTGGTLSHAAIVAREYNIPAVLAAGDATAKLKDGDMVLVNASEGSVTKLT